MRDKIIEMAKKHGADIVGFAPADRFPEDSPIFKIMPETKTVIGLAFRVLRGLYRGIEEGSTYYQYTSVGVETIEETVMPMAQMNVARVLEEEGYVALPQRRHQQILAEENSTNPELTYQTIYCGVTQETQIDFLDTAVRCGLGEMGLHHALLTDEYGPMVRYSFILTDAELEPTDLVEPHLCDKCGKCVKGCPGHAIDGDGNVDAWQCAVYYNGANGKKNPFMPLDALEDWEDRINIIAGEAKLTPEQAKELLNELRFYPPQHAYRCSICGRACDIECYVHLEEKGVLTKTFKTPFRKREKWEYSIEDYK